MNDEPQTRTDPARHESKRGGHGFMMIACCIPMLAIAGVLVATGVANPGFLFVAVACTVMMATMMRGMHGASRDTNDDHSHR